MKKTISITTVFQLLYCVCCITVVLCMFLYHITYQTAFGKICFRIGEILTFVNVLNPIGLICAGIHLANYLSQRKSGVKPHRRILLWVIIGPVLTTVCSLLCIIAFVHYSGGV